MVTERTIINALIIGAAFILVPFLVSSSLTVDYLPLLCVTALIFLWLAFFFAKDTLCVWPLLSTGIAGTLNFLPLPFSAYHIVCILLAFYYVTGYVLIRQKPVKLGKPEFLWPMLILTLIVLYHNHNLALRSFGGDTEGAKPAFMIYLIVFSYFCGINVSTPSIKFLSKIPFLFVIVTCVGSIPYIITTYVPSVAPLIWRVISSVNVDTYIDTQLNTSGPEGIDVGRLAAFGPVGTAIQLYLLCYYPIGTWLRPERWWVAGLSLICTALAISSGYRSVLVAYVAITMVAVWCYYSWRSLVLPAVLFIVVLMFLFASSNSFINIPENKLPLTVQRSLSFLPGDWADEVVESGKSSNDFRKGIQDVYIKEYMSKSPLLGNGFSIDKKVFDNFSDMLRTGSGNSASHEYIESKTYIEGKMFHTGWVSLYDSVGIIGFLAFIAFGWNQIRLVAHFICGPKADRLYSIFPFFVWLLLLPLYFLFLFFCESKTDRRSPLFPVYVWIMANITSAMFTFFTVFGEFNQTFMQLCLFAILLSHLSKIENTTEVPVALREHKEKGEFTGSKNAVYGYHSRP